MKGLAVWWCCLLFGGIGLDFWNFSTHMSYSQVSINELARLTVFSPLIETWEYPWHVFTNSQFDIGNSWNHAQNTPQLHSTLLVPFVYVAKAVWSLRWAPFLITGTIHSKLQAGPSMMWFFYACCRGSIRSLPAWLAQKLTFSQSINEFFTC